MGTTDVAAFHASRAEEDSPIEAGTTKLALSQVRTAQDDVPQVRVAQVRLDERGA
jgi:hypothetical protein